MFHLVVSFHFHLQLPRHRVRYLHVHVLGADLTEIGQGGVSRMGHDVFNGRPKGDCRSLTVGKSINSHYLRSSRSYRA